MTEKNIARNDMKGKMAGNDKEERNARFIFAWLRRQDYGGEDAQYTSDDEQGGQDGAAYGQLPGCAGDVITLNPKMRPINSKTPPATPKTNRGLLSEIMTTIRLSTSTPCLMGWRVEPSLVYIFEIGTSVILSFLSAARVIISDSTAKAIRLQFKFVYCLRRRARKPDSES